MSRILFRSIRNTIATAASIHLVLLGTYAIVHQKFIYINIAHILDLSLYFPAFRYDLGSAVLSAAPFVALAVIYYRREQRQASK